MWDVHLLGARSRTTWSKHVPPYPPFCFWRCLQQPRKLLFASNLQVQSPWKGHNCHFTREPKFPCYFFVLLFLKTTLQLETNDKNTTFVPLVSVWLCEKFYAMFMQELVEEIVSPFGAIVFSSSVTISKQHRTEIWAVDEREEYRRNGGEGSNCSLFISWARSTR